MRIFRTALLAGTAALLLAGTVGLARAGSAPSHVLTIQLPGGGTEQIRYSGDVAPRVVLMPDAAPLPVALAPFAGPWAPPFAAFDRIAAEMDRDTATLLQQADAMSRGALVDPGGLFRVGFGNPPAGGQSYSFVASLSGNGVCTRSMSITSQGDGAQPKVVSHSSGNCGPEPRGGAEPAVLMPQQHRAPGTVEVKATQPLYAALVHKIGAWQQ